MKTRDISICSISLTLLIIGSKIAIPISFIPLTLQTLMVILLGLVLSRKQITFTFGVFLLGGLCGLPLFANGGGFGYVAQPSFGFLLSFPIAAYFLSICRSLYQDSFIKMCIASLFALLLIYTIGAMYMYFIFQQVLMISKSVNEVLMLGVVPFLVSDGLSTLLACVIAKRVYEPICEKLKLSTMA